jgi:peptidase S8 and S53 subtilisin kexin sedolisin
MRKLGFLTMLAAVLAPLSLYAQQPVRLSGHQFVPDQNVVQASQKSGGTPLPSLGKPSNGWHNALIQLRTLPSAAEVAQLERSGIRLGDYVGGNAYWALVREGVSLQGLRASRLTSVTGIRPEWKLNDALRGGPLPEWARAGSNAAKVVVRYAPNATGQQVAAALQLLGVGDIEVVEQFRAVYAEMPLSASSKVAELPYVLSVGLYPPPAELNNYNGRIIGRASVLNTPAELGGRGLMGKGVKIGIWDANVTTHVDFGPRVHTQEYELYDAHGTHVTGTILGAGLMDPNGRGMAPKAEAWTWNFNTQRNGLSAQTEMGIAKKTENITLTSNSYGLTFSRLCSYMKQLGYRASDYNLDLLTNQYPTLQHIFAAGNDQDGCADETAAVYGKAGYGTGTNRSKNSIHVGALDETLKMTSFSSWGPTNDGRMFPTICAKGNETYSSVPDNSYKRMSGTSMACPTVTGHAALIVERYAQLNGGKDMPSVLLRNLLANTATDLGRPGPDFQFGYGLMNAERAVQALEHSWYLNDNVNNGQTKSHKITIPTGCKGLRVMLVWNDPASAKEYAWEESILVNDLNLSVKVGNTPFLPWVCDPSFGKVEEPAARKVDNLNNIEQVTLNTDELKGANEVTVTIEGKRITNTSQAYSLTWYFEEDEPRLISPADGMQVAAGGECYLALENVTAPYRIEFSYDGGETYIYRGRVKSPMYQRPIDVPADAPVTSKALVRVTDANGKVVRSPHPFTITPQVEGVELTTGECGTSGWKLKWNKVDAAKDGYVVLMANPDTDGEFKQITTTDTKEAVEVDIPSNLFTGVERPIFAVAVKTGPSSWGIRSKGVLGSYAVPVKLTEQQLPFHDYFKQIPHKYFSIKAGANVTPKFVRNTTVGLPAGANLFGLVCTKATKDFDTINYFNGEKNALNMASMTMCELDLTGISSSESVLLRIFGTLAAGNNGAKTAKMRVKAGPNGDQLLTSLQGNEVNLPSGVDEDWGYKLQGGTKHKVVIEFAGLGRNDLLAVGGVSVEKLQPKPSVRLQLASAPEDGVNLGKEKFTFLVSNTCTEALKNLLVKGYRDGNCVATAKLEELKGLDKKSVTLLVDVSSQKEMGELIDLRFECVVDPLTPASNGIVEHQVYNKGKVVPIGFTKLVSTIFGLLPSDPLETRVVKERLIFTDDGGLLKPCSTGQGSSLKFLPADPNLKIRVKFTRFSTVDGKGALRVYTCNVPSDLSRKGLVYSAYLMGDTINESTSPITFTSQADDGGILFYFESVSSGEIGSGWVAEVDLVPPANTLTLTDVKASQQGNEETGLVPLQLTINNVSSAPINDAQVVVVSGNKYVFDEKIAGPLAPGENHITTTRKIALPKATPVRLRVYIEHPSDSEGSDNEKLVYAVYDRYCIPNPTPIQGAMLSKVKYMQDSLTLSTTRSSAMSYNLTKPLVVYKGEGTAELTVTPTGKVPADYSVALWIDWNDNGELEEAERQVAALAEGDVSAVKFTLDLSKNSGGYKRARLMVGSTSELNSACNAPSLGNAQDFILSVASSAFPSKGDLELASLDIGKSGLKLKSDQPITISVANHSNTDYEGTVKAKITVDDLAPVEEELNFIGANKLQAFTGTKEITLDSKANLSAVGLHTVTVELLDNPVVENNKQVATVSCIVPATDGLFALDFKTQKTQDEWVDLTSTATRLNSSLTAMSVEMVFRIDKPQFSTLMLAPGFKVYTTYNMAGGIPDNCIAMILGGAMLAYTPAQSITPGQWHHLTIAMDEIENGFFGSDCDLAVYIDGKECTLTTEGSGAPKFSGQLKLCPKFDGQLKLFRASKVALGPSDIKPFELVRKDDGKLPTSYISEFAFNEGTSNNASVSGIMFADIHASLERLTQADGGIWMPVKDVIGGFKFEHQAKQEETSPNSYTITFELGSPEQVKGTITTSMPGATVTYKDAKIDANTVFDFAQPVVLDGKAQFFGHALSQTLTLTRKEDLSNACDLTEFKLEKGNHDGLNEDIVVSSPEQTVQIKIPAAKGVVDPAKVKPTFLVSQGASLMLGDTKLTSGESVIDLSAPQLVTVVAANGSTKSYELVLAMEQSITWSLESLSYTYGDNPVDAKLSVSPNHEPVVTSDRAEVASVVNGELRIGVPGTANLTATSPAYGAYGNAAEVVKTITVQKKTTDVRVANKSYNFGEPLTLALDYTSLVNPEDYRTLPDPFAKDCFTVKNSSNTVVNPSSVLPQGIYTVEAVAGKGYETEFYKITPANGQFEIVQGSVWTVTVTVNDGSSSPIQDATVIVGDKATKTDASGTAKLYLSAGQKYTLTVRKEGYMDASKEVDLTTSQEKNETITLLLANLTLTYKVANQDEGEIVGETEQKLAPNTKGQPVWATPKPGFAFDKWDDNSTANPRTDENLTANKTVTASFTPLQFTLKYAAGTGGKIKSGNGSQTVGYNADGTEVEVEPEDGYYFIAWSDGVKTEKRKDKGVKANIDVTANFAAYQQLPCTNNFESGEFGEGWYTESVGKTYNPWFITNVGQASLSPLHGFFATCNSDKEGSGTRTTSFLYSPKFTLGDDWKGDILVSFVYALKTLFEADLALEMCLDGGAWTSLKAFEAKAEKPTVYNHEVKEADLSGKKTVQFRWKYDAGWSYAAEIDDISISKKVEKVKIHYKATPEGSGTFTLVNSDGSQMPGITEQEVEQGATPAVVIAEPAAGFQFASWDDGSKNAKLADNSPACVEATRTASFTDATKATITYRVLPAGTGKCQVNGTDATEQTVTKGADAAVTAVATPGYHFIQWAENSETNASFTLRNIQEDATLTATFAKDEAYSARFLAMDEQGVPVSGVAITFEGENLTTSSNGEATTTQQYAPGNYTYKAKKSPYLTINGHTSLSELQSTTVITMRKSLSIQFNVRNANGDPLAGAKITTQYGEATTSSSGDVLVSVALGKLSYTVTKAGYADVKGSTVISTTSPAPVTVVLPALRKIALTVKDGATPLADAVVVVGDETKITGADGKAEFEREDGKTYSASVSHSGYVSQQGTIALAGTDYTYDVVLIPVKHTVTFIVTDGFAALKDAALTIDGQTLQTDDQGKATQDLKLGTYHYTVALSPYHNVEGDITVMANVTEKVTLTRDYSVTFQVVDVNGVALKEATLEVDGAPLPLDNDAKAQVTLAPGSHLYKATLEGHTTREASVNVSNKDIEEKVVLTEALYTVTFTVKDGEEPVKEATIEIEGQTPTTDDNGVATVDLHNGDYTFKVTKEGYKEYNGSVKVDNAAAAVGVALVKNEVSPSKYTVTFAVKDTDGKAVPGATVEINSQSLPTNDRGEATIDLPEGTYPYTVKKDGYNTFTDKLTVAGKSVLQSVTLQQTPHAVESSLLADVAVYPNPCHDELHLRSTSALRTLAVVNSQGQTVLTATHNGAAELALRVDSLPAGLYLLQLTDTAGAIRTLRFAKQ